jgi:membrane protein implicated in regulation of membrane protease activity
MGMVKRNSEPVPQQGAAALEGLSSTVQPKVPEGRVEIGVEGRTCRIRGPQSEAMMKVEGPKRKSMSLDAA